MTSNNTCPYSFLFDEVLAAPLCSVILASVKLDWTLDFIKTSFQSSLAHLQFSTWSGNPWRAMRNPHLLLPLELLWIILRIAALLVWKDKFLSPGQTIYCWTTSSVWILHCHILRDCMQLLQLTIRNLHNCQVPADSSSILSFVHLVHTECFTVCHWSK